VTFPPFVHRLVTFVDGLVPSGLRSVIRRMAPSLSGQIYVLGNYEPELVTAFREGLAAGDTVFDIGGHVGYSALVAATLVGPQGRVVVFEPNPDNRIRLRHNLELNPDLSARITVESAAVSDRVGTAYFAGEATVGHLAASGIEVPTTTVDHYVETHAIRPRLIKMDIEGAEALAMPGARVVLHDVRPVILVEVHDERAHDAVTTAASAAQYRVQIQTDGAWREGAPWTGRALYRMAPV
jgi:FkbM family methyltransferase